MGEDQTYSQRRIQRIIGGAVAAALATTTPAAHAIVQDYNRARGADGYTLTNTAGEQSGTIDGQEFQLAPSSPGISGEFWVAAAALGQPFDLVLHAPPGPVATATAIHHAGSRLVTATRA